MKKNFLPAVSLSYQTDAQPLPAPDRESAPLSNARPGAVVVESAKCDNGRDVFRALYNSAEHVLGGSSEAVWRIK